jgi:hypothetical protein
VGGRSRDTHSHRVLSIDDLTRQADGFFATLACLFRR